MDVDVPEPPTMTLVIRTPDQACGDLRAEDVRVSWTVRELKEHLSEVHPSRPVSPRVLPRTAVRGLLLGGGPGAPTWS